MDYNTIYINLFNLLKLRKNTEFINELSKVNENDISFDINIKDNNGKYFINYAIIMNNIEIAKYLITKKIRLDVDSNDNSLLMIPIFYNYDEMLEILLSADKLCVGSSLVSFRDKLYKIPLHYAIELKNMVAIKLLLQYNSNVNITDKEGYNSLFYAVKSKSYEICNLIIPHISNINAKCNTGENVLHIACNLQMIDIVELLLKYKITINSHDNTNEITPLHYCVLLNNKTLVSLLINNGGDISAQDISGNTPLHYCIMEDNYEIFIIIIEYSMKHNLEAINMWNIEGEIPLHLVLKKSDDNLNKKYVDKLLEKSNLNIQDKNGNSCLYYLVKSNLWKDYISILREKKLDILIKNKNNVLLIDSVKKSDHDDFINMVANSYLYNLKNGKKQWTQELDIVCGKVLNNLSNNDKAFLDNNSDLTDTSYNEICKIKIIKKIKTLITNSKKKVSIQCYDKSYPMVAPPICIRVNEGVNLNFCTFTGNRLDILIGLIYLLKMHKNVCSILPENIDCNLDKSINKCELLNFEIVWANKTLVIEKDFVNKFLKCKKRFIVVPLGIEIKEGGHAGYLIYDSKIKELERFETFGGVNSLYGAYYNSELLDTVLETTFKNIDSNIKYIKPHDFLPKIGFQLIDIIEKKYKKIGDPGGFCALWSIWYVDMRLTYFDIPRKKLVKILINNIKRENISFKNMIRNYAKNIIDIRDKLLNSSQLTINDWINKQYTHEQFNSILKNINLELSLRLELKN